MSYIVGTGFYAGHKKMELSFLENALQSSNYTNSKNEIVNVALASIQDCNIEQNEFIVSINECNVEQYELIVSINECNVKQNGQIVSIHACNVEQTHQIQQIHTEIYEENEGILYRLQEVTETANANYDSINSITPPGLSINQATNTEAISGLTSSVGGLTSTTAGLSASITAIDFYLFTPPNPILIVPCLNNILAAMTAATLAMFVAKDVANANQYETIDDAN
jgi:hypothetical protein